MASSHQIEVSATSFKIGASFSMLSLYAHHNYTSLSPGAFICLVRTMTLYMAVSRGTKREGRTGSDYSDSLMCLVITIPLNVSTCLALNYMLSILHLLLSNRDLCDMYYINMFITSNLSNLLVFYAVAITLAIEDFAHVHVLQKALLVCTVNVPWLNDTIGVFYSLDIVGTVE